MLNEVAGNGGKDLVTCQSTVAFKLGLVELGSTYQSPSESCRTHRIPEDS
jgi:hypothetical protein